MLVVSHYFAAHRGGIEIFADGLVRALSSDHDVTWAASAEGPPEPIPGARVVGMSASNWIERRVGVPFPLWSPGALVALFQLIGRADVVHLHDSLYMGNVAAALFARLQGRPVVVTQQIASVAYRNPVLRTLMLVANATVGRLVLSSARAVVFVSEAIRQETGRALRLGRRARFIPNGVDLETFDPGSAAEREASRARVCRELGLAAARSRLLFVGRFVEKKGLPALRALAAALPGHDWVFAGWGPDDPGAWGLANVRVVRDRRGASLRDLYRASDLLVLPSFGEGFPLVVQEAFACGLPALLGTETCRGQPRSSALLRAAPVFPAEPERTARVWASEVRALLEPGRLPEPAALRRHAEEEWSWAATARRYAVILREALTERRR